MPLPDGYVIKELLPEHAELVAKCWSVDDSDWFVASYPAELRRRYLKELITRYGTLGAFTKDDPTQPVGWTFRKNGALLQRE